MITTGWIESGEFYKTKAFFVFVVTLLFCSSSFAGPGKKPPSMPDNPRYSFRSVGDDVGLNTRGVTSMLQDSKGFIWIGTQDGLFRCDGAEVQRFGTEHGLPDSWVREMIEGPDGTIWFEAGGKLAYYDGLEFGIFKPPYGVEYNIPPSYLPQRIGIGSSGLIYLATENGLWEMSTDGSGLAKLWTANNKLPDTNCRAVLVDENGIVWIAAAKSIATLDPKTGKVETWPIEADVITQEGSSLVIDRDGTIWFRTINHLHYKKPGDSRFSMVKHAIGQGTVMGRPSLDLEGNIMIPSAVGLFLHNNGKWSQISAENGLRASAVSYAIEDREGELWIGLLGVGAQRLTGRRSWVAWTSDEGLPDNGVWGAIRDKYGRLWVATNNGIGVWLHKKHRWAIIQREDGLAGDRIWKLAVGPLGYVWALSRRSGFNRIDPKTLIPQPLESPIPIDGVPMELTSAPDGSLWLGTTEVVIRVHAHDTEIVYEKVDLPEDFEGSHEVIKFAKNGTVWIGGTNGAGRFDGVNWRHFSIDDGLKASRVMNIAVISENEAWFGYYEGVGATRLRLDGSNVKADHFGRATGLASDRVWMLERDRDANVWVGSSDGISVINPKGEVRIYNQGDGLLCNDINQAAFLAQSDGSVIIGTGRGMAYHKSSIQRRQEEPPIVAFTSVMLGGVERLQEKNPTIEYAQNIFVAGFVGLTFRNASKVRYRYRLHGWDREPISSRLREVRYAALPPGKYNLEVSCRSAAGIWSEDPVRYPFTVLPPWWQRWWSRLGALLLLCGLVYGLLRFRTRRLAADRNRLEKAVKERNAQLRAANKELQEMSFTDALTKTHNRRFFSSVIETDVASTLRKYDRRESGNPDPNKDLLFFIIDLDHFKRVNDVYGHSNGDTVLVETSRRLADCLRHSDLLVRWGGEEFLILCREADRNEASAVAKRILDVVGSMPFHLSGDVSFHRTCSVGWASLPAFQNSPGTLAHETVLELADKALYVAKQTGRNRAVGVEIIEGADSAQEHLWLDDPIEQLEGKHITLKRVEGPHVPAGETPSRAPTRSSLPPAAED